MDESTKEFLMSRVPGLREISSYNVLTVYGYISSYYVAVNVRKFTKKFNVEALQIDNIIYANNINILIVDSMHKLNVLRNKLISSLNQRDTFDIWGKISSLVECIRNVLKNENFFSFMNTHWGKK